ncbi:MAG: DUF805 domain-containing protein [Alphaproteobacteria bacterium]
MHWRQYLFSFHGRATRAQWWLFVLILLVFNFVSTTIAVWIFDFPGLFVGLFLTLALLLWPALAISGRRLHDRGKSGWWLLLFFLAPIVLSWLKLRLTIHLGLAGYADPPLEAVVISFATLAIVVWGLIELGILRGTRGENKYGPDPLAHKEMKST